MAQWLIAFTCRVPKFTQRTLNSWYHHGLLFRWRTIKYYLSRVQYNIDLLEDTQILNRTRYLICYSRKIGTQLTIIRSEFARVFGIDFFSVLSRGSQYKVEAIMARIVKPENFVMVTPSKPQVREYTLWLEESHFRKNC